jgi:hypothetical protein
MGGGGCLLACIQTLFALRARTFLPDCKLAKIRLAWFATATLSTPTNPTLWWMKIYMAWYYTSWINAWMNLCSAKYLWPSCLMCCVVTLGKQWPLSATIKLARMLTGWRWALGNKYTVKKMPLLIFDLFPKSNFIYKVALSGGEILTAPPDVKYKDVFLSTKSGSCCDPSGRDPLTSQTDRHTEPTVAIRRFIHEWICVNMTTTSWRRSKPSPTCRTTAARWTKHSYNSLYD